MIAAESWCKRQEVERERVIFLGCRSISPSGQKNGRIKRSKNNEIWLAPDSPPFSFLLNHGEMEEIVGGGGGREWKTGNVHKREESGSGCVFPFLSLSLVSLFLHG